MLEIANYRKKSTREKHHKIDRAKKKLKLEENEKFDSDGEQ